MNAKKKKKKILKKDNLWAHHSRSWDNLMDMKVCPQIRLIEIFLTWECHLKVNPIRLIVNNSYTANLYLSRPLSLSL